MHPSAYHRPSVHPGENSKAQEFASKFAQKMLDVDRTNTLINRVVVEYPNPQYVYGERLMNLFGQYVQVDKVTAPSDPTSCPVVIFSLPTHFNWHCNVRCNVTGVVDGKIICTMTLEELDEQEGLSAMQDASGI